VKRAVATCVCLVNAVAFATYAAHCAGLTYALPTATPGDVMEPFRHLQWAFTTPMLIVVLACVAGDGRAARRTVARALLADFAMLAFGFGERYAAGVGIRTALFLAGAATYAETMRCLRLLFCLAEAAVSAPEDASSLHTLWRHTLLVWSGFPVARLLRVSGAIGPNGEEVAFALLDVAAKTGYSCLLLTGTFTLLDSLTARRLARCDELMALIRGTEDGPSRLAQSLASAYREAGGFPRVSSSSASASESASSPFDFRPERPRAVVSAREALLDAAVGEYVALAQGRSDAWAPPSPLLPHSGGAGGGAPRPPRSPPSPARRTSSPFAPARR
jgi:bacteriorhodopsin